ncbi:MAG TPA: SRPBCC family protein [Myxococcaceae bacterium]|jgi:hypothetical protein
MSAWSTEASAVTPATPEAIWALYEQVGAWSAWDHEVESSRLDGPFQAGSTGVLKPKGGPASKFRLTAVEPARRFADDTRLPLARLAFEHTLTPMPGGGTRIHHKVTIDGPLTFLFSRVIGRKIAAGLPHAVEALAKKAAA